MDKPSEYFIGILDFFGILVPGVVAMALVRLQYPEVATRISKSLDLPGNQGVVAFIVVAYLAGYLFNVTSLALDRLTGTLQHRSFERYSGQRLYRRASELKDECLGEKDRALLPTYIWALANVRNHFPVWSADIERLDAHTALFRSMSLVLVFTAFLEFCRSDWKWGFASTSGAAISFLVFKHLRWQRIQTVYEYYVALHAISEGDRVDPHGLRALGRTE